jgi:hypothetical protein
MKRFIALLGATLLAGTVAHAAPFIVLNRMIEVTPPTGYCALAGADRRQELFERQKTLSEPAGIVLQVSVPCEDLKKFDTGTIDGFERQAVVMVVKARGQLKLDNRSKEEFLGSLGAGKSIDIVQINERLRTALASKSASAALQAMTPIGSDGTAFYWSAVGEAQIDGGTRKKVASVVAAVLVNGLPLSIQASEREGSTDGTAPATVAQKYVQSVVSRN